MIRRVAYVADIHVDRIVRWDELKRVATWVAEDMRARAVTTVCVAGDVWERYRVAAEEQNFAKDWFRSLASFSEVVGVYGNHDGAGTLDFLNTQDPIGSITFYAKHGVHFTKSGIAIACLPWQTKANLLASIGRPVTHEESDAVARECLRNFLLEMRDKMASRQGPRLLCAHAMIDGARTDHDQPIVGADMAVSLEDLGLVEAHFSGVGHVHAQNAWSWNGAPIVYPGALIHRNFGEPGPKGYVLAEFDGPRLVKWERIPTPTTPMVLLSGEWSHGGLNIREPEAGLRPAGSEIRLRYSVAADARDAARARALEIADQFRELGAVSVKVEEEVTATTRARVPDVAVASTIWDRLRALWAARGEQITEERLARLQPKVTEIEEATPDAA